MPALPRRPSTTIARRCAASCTDRTLQVLSGFQALSLSKSRAATPDHERRARQGPPIGQRIETQFFGLLTAHAAVADALPHCNHRVYISGNGISLVSSWMQRQLFALSFCLSQTDGRHS